METCIISFEQYMEKTKKAVTDTFHLLDTYKEVINSIPKGLWLLTEEQINNPTPEIKERLAKEDEFIANSFSLNVLAGLILQIAYNAINNYSSIKEIPDDYEDLKISERAKTIRKFFVGRIIDNIHIGLIIYAARNQWAHHWEKELKGPNVSIFERIATCYSPTIQKYYKSPFYDLKNETVDIFTSNILYLLGWHKYKDYEKDMLELSKDF